MEGYGDSSLEGQFDVKIFEIRNGTVRIGDTTTLQNVEGIRVHGGTLLLDCRGLCPDLVLKDLIVGPMGHVQLSRKTRVEHVQLMGGRVTVSGVDFHVDVLDAYGGTIECQSKEEISIDEFNVAQSETVTIDNCQRDFAISVSLTLNPFSSLVLASQTRIFTSTTSVTLMTEATSVSCTDGSFINRNEFNVQPALIGGFQKPTPAVVDCRLLNEGVLFVTDGAR